MTYREALTEAAARLASAVIPFGDTPLLDASVLMAFAAGMSREKLFASYPDEIPGGVLGTFNRLIEERCSGRPVSYIRKIKEFYGRTFTVNDSVLVPRPDTEIIVEKALQLAEDSSLRVLDLCTGSGCIAVTLKLEAAQLSLTASDVSEAALQTARKNAEALGADIDYICSSLFDKIEGRFDMIVTNPPYLTTAETSSMKDSGWPEPSLALDGGVDGLDLIRIIIQSSLDYLNDNSYLLIEAGPEQAGTIAELLSEAGYADIEITPDLAGRNRVTSGRKIGTRD